MEVANTEYHLPLEGDLPLPEESSESPQDTWEDTRDYNSYESTSEPSSRVYTRDPTPPPMRPIQILPMACSKSNPTPQQASAPHDTQAGTNGDKLVVVMVGLPGRGKTYIARKLARYLRFFHGAPAEVMNIGNYRRKLFGAEQTHEFFDYTNEKHMDDRFRAAELAMQDLKKYITSGNELGRVAVFDGSNIQRFRRKWILKELLPIVQSKTHIIFVECVTTDSQVLNIHLEGIQRSLPDYEKLTDADAAADFSHRIEHSKAAYEPIDDDSLSWIKIVDGGRQVS